MRRSVLLLLPALTACANMAGLDGKSEFACKAPDGVVCTSVSGVYANTLAGTLATWREGNAQSVALDFASEARPKSPAAPLKPYSAEPPAGTPLLSPPRVLRLWLAPWVDEDGDLHDQAYLYVMWHRGEWQLGHTEAGIRSQFAPIAPISAAPKAVPAGTKAQDSETLREGSRRDARDTVLESTRAPQPAKDDER